MALNLIVLFAHSAFAANVQAPVVAAPPVLSLAPTLTLPQSASLSPLAPGTLAGPLLLPSVSLTPAPALQAGLVKPAAPAAVPVQAVRGREDLRETLGRVEDFASAYVSDGGRPISNEKGSALGTAFFDHAGSAGAVSWEREGFEGSAGGRISYKLRMPEGAEGKAPTVFVGGLALAESFEPYFQRHNPEAGQFTLWLRGLPPSEWVAGAGVFNADARDLARMIVLAGTKSGSQRVDLALHSYSTLLFQQLLGMREDPLVAEALRYLKGAKVTLLMGSTHYEGVERDMDAMSALKLHLSRLFVNVIDHNDALSGVLRALTELNPFLFPGAAAFEFGWGYLRSLLLSSAGKDVAKDLKSRLREPWAADLEPLRYALLKLIDENGRRPGWQEAALRRFVDLLNLDFSPEDVRYLRGMGVRLNTVAAVDDDILPWDLQRHLLMRLGIEAPARVPKPGTVLTDPEGRFRLTVVDSDHFFPLREPDRLEELLRD